MADNDYHFITTWRMDGTTISEVKEVLGNADDLVRWWPSVYLKVETTEQGDADGIGKVVSLYTKGWLPYTLRWSFRVTEVTATGFSLEAWGDFVGRGIWTFGQDGDAVVITYDWKVRADKPMLRRFSGLFKPVFSANHHWAMKRGEESLRLELKRRRAASPEAKAAVAQPPQPTFKFLL